MATQPYDGARSCQNARATPVLLWRSPESFQQRLTDMRADGAMIGQPERHGSGHRDIWSCHGLVPVSFEQCLL